MGLTRRSQEEESMVVRRDMAAPKLDRSSFHIRRWVTCGMAIIAAVALTACGGSGSSASKALKARLFFAPATLDPDAANDLGAITLAAYAYDTPVALRGGKFVPELASRWEVTPTSAKLWIKPGVKCSDGSSLTAEDVAGSINRLKNPQTKAARADSWFGSATGYTATANAAANTAEVKLNQPYGDLLYGLSQTYIVCHAALENPKLLLTSTYGSGPYKLTSAVAGDHYLYTVNKDYAWGPGGATNAGNNVPSSIDFEVIENETTATNEFLTGQLDLTMAQGPDTARLNTSSRVTEKGIVIADTYAVRINHAAQRVTANANVRRMLFAATNRLEFAQALFGKEAKVPETAVLPTGICYQPSAVGSAMLPFSRTLALKYAAAAGYHLVGGKLMKDGTQLTVKVIIPNIVGAPAGDFLSAEWSKLGIDVQIQELPVAQAVTKVFTPGSDWDMFVESTGGGESPTTLLRSFGGPPPPKGQQYTAVDNPEFNRISAIAKAKLTTKACPEWAAAERALYQQADVIPFADAQAAWYGHDVTFKPWLLSAVYPETLRLK
jgi:peptide/nickel transport system substrate-binding protein